MLHLFWRRTVWYQYCGLKFLFRTYFSLDVLRNILIGASAFGSSIEYREAHLLDVESLHGFLCYARSLVMLFRWQTVIYRKRTNFDSLCLHVLGL